MQRKPATHQREKAIRDVTRHGFNMKEEGKLDKRPFRTMCAYRQQHIMSITSFEQEQPGRNNLLFAPKYHIFAGADPLRVFRKEHDNV